MEFFKKVILWLNGFFLPSFWIQSSVTVYLGISWTTTYWTYWIAPGYQNPKKCEYQEFLSKTILWEMGQSTPALCLKLTRQRSNGLRLSKSLCR